MSLEKLSAAIRQKATMIQNASIERTGYSNPEDADTAELLFVLARIVEGKAICEAFGAPGDWGYGTPVGDALAGR